MLRVFVALPIPLEVAEQLVALVPPDLEGLKRVKPELLHVTLAFVGWLREDRVPDVVAAVGGAAQAGRSFEVELDAVGRFPPKGRPRVVWVGTGAAAPRIAALGTGVRDALAEAGVPFDPKPLQPHVTLARVREDAALGDARAIGSAVGQAKVPAGLRFRAESIHVMQSKLTPRGPLYSSLAEARLPEAGRDGGTTEHVA
jgi:2'-5' RNA ligase